MSSASRASERARRLVLPAAAASGAALAAPGTALANAPTRPDEVWASWNLDWAVLAWLGLAALLYASGLRARGAPEGGALAAGRAACFAGGLALIAVAIASPLDAAGHALLYAHMAQHMVILACAAPLIALARPWPVLARGLPAAAVRLGARVRRPLRHGRRLLAPAAWAAIVLVLHVGAVWAWHLPPLYAVALHEPAVHALSHATLLATAILFWAVVIAAGRRGGVGRPAGIALAFGAAAGTGILGALVTFATASLYPAHASAAPDWGMTALSDQQLGGVLMWIPGGMVYLIAAVVLLLGLLDDRAPHRSPAPAASKRAAGA